MVKFSMSVKIHVLVSSLLHCSFASVTLNNIIQKNFPEEYAERKAEHDSLTNFGVDLVPLFVMDVVIPCQKYHLHIFEPRYRLMVSYSDVRHVMSR